uniref:Uncharacterized protein n=1 Tax=Zonotrichia albicollis TaxID=44394 RepID=A0A8D2MBF6_ZONAL
MAPDPGRGLRDLGTESQTPVPLILTYGNNSQLCVKSYNLWEKIEQLREQLLRAVSTRQMYLCQQPGALWSGLPCSSSPWGSGSREPQGDAVQGHMGFPGVGNCSSCAAGLEIL